MLRKGITLITIVIGLLLLTACCSGRRGTCDRRATVEMEMWVLAQIAPMASIEELIETAAHVVRVEVIDTHVQLIAVDSEHKLEPVTRYALRVLEVFKGDARADDVLVAQQAGGVHHALPFVIHFSTYSPIHIGEELIMFLNASRGQADEPYRWCPYSGAFREVICGETGEVLFESVNPANTWLGLTKTDLQ